MLTVIIETPYRHASAITKLVDPLDPGHVHRNVLYARRAMLDSLRRGEAPFLSHLLYTIVLDDDDPEQRRLGMAAGFTLGARLERTVVYIDRGISGGMADGIREAMARSRPIEFRTFDGLDEGPSRTLSWSEACAMSPHVSALLAFPVDDR